MPTSPPYQKPEEQFNDMPRQEWRRFRKWLGLPASGDVRVLSVMLRDLKDSAEDMLGFEVTSAGASVPQYPAIYDEDIADAFDYIGLEYLQILWNNWFQHTYLTYGNIVALAGHDLGLCPDIKNASTCWDGSFRDSYFIVHYSKHEVLMSHVETSYMGAYTLTQRTARFSNLGSDRVNDDYYWYYLRQTLLMWWSEFRLNPPSTIILTGESAQEPEFKKCVVESMMGIFGIAVPPILDDDPEYVQAKGVAELLRRRKYLPKPTRPYSTDVTLQAVDEGGENQLPLDL
jgi:hypothetical protein